MRTIKNQYLKIKQYWDHNQLRFKSDGHNVYTEEINKIAIRNNDDKRLQTFDGITTYQYGTPVVKVCELEMLAKIKGVPIAMYY